MTIPRWNFPMIFPKVLPSVMQTSPLPVRKKNPEYRFDVEWAHVKGADGYEIKTEGITQNVENGKNHGKLHIPSKRAANEDADYYGSISIRPFRYVNGRKQYGRTYRTYCEYETGC